MTNLVIISSQIYEHKIFSGFGFVSLGFASACADQHVPDFIARQRVGSGARGGEGGMPRWLLGGAWWVVGHILCLQDEAEVLVVNL